MEIYFAFVSFEEWLVRDLCFGNTKRRWSAVKQVEILSVLDKVSGLSETLVLDLGSRLQ